MVQMFPFRGLRYNLEKLQAEGVSLDAVAIPPYDVINDAQQQAFYEKHTANFIRVDLNQKTEQDTPLNNPYTRAARALTEWEQTDYLIPESQPAVYAYSQIWEENGETIERKGMIALLRLESFESGQVLPHEYTLKGPKQDRMQLMHSTLCNLSQVFLIYSDPQRVMEELLYPESSDASAWAQTTDHDGVIHRFRPVMAANVIAQLQALFAQKSLLIADGHHRYETALAFQREVRERLKNETGEEPPAGALLSDYAMVFLTNMDDPGLKVYPTHRLLHAWPEGWDAEQFEQALLARYDIVDANETFTYKTTEKSLKLTIKASAIPADLPPLLDTFDAALLETTVFQGILQTTGEALKQAHILGFYRNENEIEQLWQNGEVVAGFYLAAPSVQLVHQICESGHRMPQKSTYFYPKIQSGLVIYPYRTFLKQSAHALSAVVPNAQPVNCVSVTA